MEATNINKLDFSFQDRAIAWIDVIGMKANKLLETEKFLKTIVTLTSLTSFFQKYSAHKHEVISNLHPKAPLEYSKVEFTNFSDSFVFSLPVSSTGESIAELIEYVSRFQRILFEYEDFPILCRGVICIGNLLHNEEFCSGLGLDKAYKMENSLIYYPRVVVLDDVINLLAQHKIEIDNNAIIKDIDGLSFINYITGLTSVQSSPEESNNELLYSKIINNDIFLRLNFKERKDFLEKRVSTAKQEALNKKDKNSEEYIKTLQKWSWLQYHLEKLLKQYET